VKPASQSASAAVITTSQQSTMPGTVPITPPDRTRVEDPPAAPFYWKHARSGVRSEMTRYLLVTNFQSGVVDAPMEEWRPEEVTAHLDYYRALHRELVASGELVESEVLTGPDLGKIVTSDGGSAPVVTDGPFQEFKEWIAGYQIVDVESEARAIEIAAKISAVPGPGGVATQQPIQVRQVMDDAPGDAAEMESFLRQVGGAR
jgi:hypothetical protein